MTMSSHRQSKKKFTVLAVLALLVILFSINYKTGGVVSSSVRNIAAPLWSAGDSASLRLQSFKSTFTTKQRLAKELDSLRAELKAVQDLKYENLYLRAQNSTLLSLANTNTLLQGEGDRTLVQVFSGVGVRPYGTLLISTDPNQRVQVGSIVLTTHSVALGNVSSVSSRVATVRLFSAAERSVEVVIGNDSESPVVATAVGVGSGNFVISVPRDTEVSVGDAVYSSAALGRAIAIVGSVEKDPTNPLTTLRARVPANIQGLQTVLVE